MTIPSKQPPALQIVKASERPRFGRVLIQGEPGSGKTHFVGTMPKPILYIEADPHGGDTLIGVDGIDIVELTSYGMMQQVEAYLYQHILEYQSVAIDSITSVQRYLVDEVAKSRYDKLAGKGTENADTYAPDPKGWQEILSRLRRLMLDLNKYPIHLCYTALTQMDANPLNPMQRRLYPLLQGQIQGLIGGLISDFGMAYIQQPVNPPPGGYIPKPADYKISFVGSDKFPAKSRTKAGLILSDPHFDNLIS